MNISGSFGEVDKVGFAQPRQASIDSVEHNPQAVSTAL